MSGTARRADIDAQAGAVLADLENMSYGNVATKWNTSRGKVYQLAVEHRRRKHEARIQERKHDRAARQREFLQEVLNASQKADVLDYLDGLPDNSVQLHLTSVPYNVGKRYGDSPDIDSRRFHYYLGWLLMVLSEMERSLAPGGVLFLQVGATKDQDGELYPLDALLIQHLKAMHLAFASRVAWVTSHGLTPQSRLSERYETALVMTKGECKVFNANAARIPQKQPDKRAFKGPNKGRISSHPLGAWPSNVWTLANCGYHRDGGDHPAPFPIELARRAVLLYSMPGDLVVDAFCGRGTTLEAAKQTGRYFSGADLFYEDVRAQRLAKAVPDLYCELPGVTDESIAVWQAEAIAVNHQATPISPEENDRLLTLSLF